MTQTTTRQQLEAELAEARGELSRLKEASQATITVKASPKGALSVYGIRRFPVTFYLEEWHKMLTPQFRAKVDAVAAEAEAKGQLSLNRQPPANPVPAKPFKAPNGGGAMSWGEIADA